MERPSSGRPVAGQLLHDAGLADYTSWRVGGPADRLYLPLDSADLLSFLAGGGAGDESVFWLGLGSNLLIRDGGIRGLVICTKGRLRRLERLGEHRVFVESGVPCAHVAKFCGDQGWCGAEFLAGIPGTMGGALAMNAGAFGGETWPLVERVWTMTDRGVERWRSRDEFMIGYRSVVGLAPDECFLGAELQLAPGDAGSSRQRIRELLARRSATQPTNMPSCGSVFRNPVGDHAGRLIEECGLKGHSIGGAQVSPKHANFIVNTGHATARDIESMIQFVRDTVRDRHGIDLQPEVRIVGTERPAGSPDP
ncbi:MAG: UDP-N-acetylmuramate dehydrogenase [Methylotetracoccus sp.]